MENSQKLQAGEYLMYLRKSRQDDPNETVEEVLSKHEIRLQEHALRILGYEIPEKNIYREIVSGETIDDRPKVREVFRRMEQGNVAGVFVVNCSRLSRGDLLDCGTVVRAFLYTNTLIITPEKTIDPKDKFDRKMLEVELTSGNYYLEASREYMENGRIASIKRGNFVGSAPPYGYTRQKIGKDWILIINEEEAQYVRIAFDMYANKGFGANAIANRLNQLGATTKNGNLFRVTTIRQMLINEVYCGWITYKRKPTVKVLENGKVVKKRRRVKEYIIVKGKHAPIISQELFDKAQAQKSKVTREKPTTELHNIYAGLIKCNKCGMAIAMRIHRSNGVEVRKPRYYCRSGIYCNNKSTNVEQVYKAIEESLIETLEGYKIKLAEEVKSPSNENELIIKSLEKKFDELKKRQNEICDFLEKGLYTVEMFLERNKKIQSELERVTSALTAAKDYVPLVKQYESKIIGLTEAINALKDDNVSIKSKNNLLKNVIKVIKYEKNESNSTAPDTKDEVKFSLQIELL